MFLTGKEIAERYKIALSTVYKLTESGALPKPIYVGSSKRWKISDIEAFENDKSKSNFIRQEVPVF